MDCLFCKIVAGEIPSKKVFENSETMVFLDINPASKGHMLAIPKKHISSIYEIRESDLEGLMRTVKLMASRARDNLGAEGINVLQNNGRISGQIVDHIHVHIIPRYKGDGVDLHLPRAQITEADLISTQERLSKDNSQPATYSGSVGPGW